MKSITHALLMMLGVIGMVLLHIVMASLLPLPWRSINILFVLLIFFMMRKETGAVVWLAFVTHACIELYATTPFGVILFSSTVALLVSFWLFQYVLTNRSWYSACVISMLAVILYRFLYTGILLTFAIRFRHALPPWGYLAQAYLWEIVLTSAITGALYALAAPRREQKKLFSI